MAENGKRQKKFVEERKKQDNEPGIYNHYGILSWFLAYPHRVFIRPLWARPLQTMENCKSVIMQKKPKRTPDEKKMKYLCSTLYREFSVHAPCVAPRRVVLEALRFVAFCCCVAAECAALYCAAY
jgi:hypothetical protein